MPDQITQHSLSATPVPTIESLRKHLQVALQLEHATLPPYLTALYSIKPNTNVDAVQVLRAVAVEEMLHLVQVANVLKAVGGTPKLTGKDFVPEYPACLPDGETDFLVHLRPLSLDAVETFLKIERPTKTAPTPEKVVVPRPHLHGSSRLAAHPDSDLHYYSIGDFYRAIEEALDRLEHEANATGGSIFTRGDTNQVTPEHYYSGGGTLITVTNLETAKRAINAVIGQGEGEDRGIYGPDGELAHYYRFQQLKYGKYYQKPATGEQQPIPNGPNLPVNWQEVYPIKEDAKLADYEPGSEAHDAAKAFNQAYADFLGVLEEAFNGKPDRLTAAVPMMFDLRNKANQLIRNPLKDGSKYNAAPTFEVAA